MELSFNYFEKIKMMFFIKKFTVIHLKISKFVNSLTISSSLMLMYKNREFKPYI